MLCRTLLLPPLLFSLAQVTQLVPEETENPLGGYGKTVSHVVVGLKTVKGVHWESTVWAAVVAEFRGGYSTCF